MTPELLNLLTQIFEICIIPLLGVLTTFAVKYIKAKSEQIQVQTDNDLVDKYVCIAADIITKCVIATNQTYVETLKKQGKFDQQAQEVAFQKTLLAVQAMLTAEAKQCLTEFYGDLDIYITSAIEAAVNEKK